MSVSVMWSPGIINKSTPIEPYSITDTCPQAYNKRKDGRKRIMKAVWNGAVIAEANKEELIRIESNWYFPPASIKHEYFKPSDTHTTCPWKGLASYYNVDVDGNINGDAAWYYHEPTPRSKEIVKKDFTDYVAFWRGVEVVE